MLMEQEAPLLFHTVFAGAVILTVAYLLHWRGHSPQKKPLELILYFVLLQIPAYILVFYAMMCPGSGERTFAFAMGGFLLADRNSGSHAGDSRSVGLQHK